MPHPDALPFGSVDTPTNNATGVVGAIAVTGWALDDIGVSQVTIWRDPVTGEPAGRPTARSSSATPRRSRARGRTSTRTYSLPFDYQRRLGLHAPDQHAPRRRATAHSRCTCMRPIAKGTRCCSDRASSPARTRTATEPFGTIDTPDQGGSVSGTTYTNFGWALTPQPSMIPADGSTITVFIDGVPIGHPAIRLLPRRHRHALPGAGEHATARSATSTSTPRTLANGVHTIAWSVTDNNGNGEGIGSRYFTVLNGALDFGDHRGRQRERPHVCQGADVRESARTGASAGQAVGDARGGAGLDDTGLHPQRVRGDRVARHRRTDGRGVVAVARQDRGARTVSS